MKTRAYKLFDSRLDYPFQDDHLVIYGIGIRELPEDQPIAGRWHVAGEVWRNGKSLSVMVIEPDNKADVLFIKYPADVRKLKPLFGTSVFYTDTFEQTKVSLLSLDFRNSECAVFRVGDIGFCVTKTEVSKVPVDEVIIHNWLKENKR